MADTSATERAYQRLKAGILNGSIPAGPLETRSLGDQLRMSATPVREALARLHAERLVRLAPHQGYLIATPSAQRLEHLYGLLGSLLHLAMGRTSRKGPGLSREAPPLLLAGSYASDLTAVFNRIAADQPNSVLAEAIGSLNDQLFAARRHEPRIFPDADRELAVFLSLWKSGNIGDLRLRVRDHHRVRAFRVDAIARQFPEETGRI